MSGVKGDKCTSSFCSCCVIRNTFLYIRKCFVSVFLGVSFRLSVFGTLFISWICSHGRGVREERRQWQHTASVVRAFP